MDEIQVLELILQQMGELRIPIREDELREQIVAIGKNVRALRDAIAEAREKAKEAEKTDV